MAGDQSDDQAQEDLSGGQAGPGVAVQDAVVVGEVAFLAQPHDPEDGTDGARAGGQEGADGEGLGLGPDAGGEQWCKGSQDGYHLGWQIHGGRLQGRWLGYYHRSWATPPGSASQLGMEEGQTTVRPGQSRVEELLDYCSPPRG